MRPFLEQLAATVFSAVEADALPPSDHRPWPLPEGPWVMAQTWEKLLFAHWPLPATALARLIPPALTLDTFEGSAWLGITPFVLTGLRMRGLPALPGVSTFPEINVRTYVTAGGKPGVLFFSLDAGNPLAVSAARRLYYLPYFNAEFFVESSEAAVRYASRRVEPGTPPAEFSVEYEPTGAHAPAAPASLEWWLTERYCLYAQDGRRRIYRAEIHHAPWRLQRAEARIRRNTMTQWRNIELPESAPLLHYADRLDVKVWPLMPADIGA